MFDPMGRQAGRMPMTSYAGNNALGGVAAANFAQGGFDKQHLQQMRAGMGMQPPMQPPVPQMQPPGAPDPTMQNQSALAGMGQPGPMTFTGQGLPQQFQDFRQQLQDWRGLRPDRPDWRAMRGQEGFDPQQARADWRGQLQDWRGQRPEFGNWR